MSHEKSHAAILIGTSGSRTAESANTRNRLKSTRPTFYEGGVWERDYVISGHRRQGWSLLVMFLSL